MPYRHLVFYKPYGVITQFTPGSGAHERTLKEFIPVPGVYPVGRLDQDSEGLLLLTSDGRLQHRLSDPRYGHPRTYWAQVERVPGPEELARLALGVELQGQSTRPATVRLLPSEPDLPPRQPPIRERKSVPTAWLELVLAEGRNRQVRRMTAAIGHPTLRLVRVALGSLRLDSLQPGQWRDLTSEELRSLRSFRPLA